MENQINLVFNIQPISYNKSHIVFNNVLRTSTERKNFGLEMQKLLDEQMNELKKIKNVIIKFLEIRYVFSIPNMIKPCGQVSKRSLDIDNCLKGFQDEIFKRLNKINPDIDDGLVTKIIAEKMQSPDNNHTVTAIIYLN